TGADGKPASRVPLLVSDGSQFYPATTDANGDYTVTVSPGEYSVSVFARGQSAPSQTVDLAAGERATADFSMETASIEYTDVSIVDGPGGDADLGARANLQSGLLQFQLVDESSYGGPADTVGIPDDLTSLGVTDATEFRIKLTVKNFDPNSLIWGLRNAEWETRPNESVTDGTDIIVTGSTVDLQAVDTDSYGVGPLLFKSPSQVDWPTGRDSVADFGFRRTVYFGLFDLSTIPGPAQDNLNGISTTTNAQRFAPPTYENDTLRVWMAAPSKTVGGDDHTGFYQATIPDSLLEEWGVDDPESELQVTYKDRPREFSVTETDTGARINIDNIGYSASYADIQPDESAITADSGSDGGYEYSPPETTTATPTATQTQTTTATATATQTQTQTATATATQTRTATATATETPTETDGGAATPTSTGSGPGFGVAGALAALAAAVLLGRRR
ncbi:MAG: carboxypeptidase-like regulatory domain-containing protein, partial [Haloarculaceae archaeon]